MLSAKSGSKWLVLGKVRDKMRQNLTSSTFIYLFILHRGMVCTHTCVCTCEQFVCSLPRSRYVPGTMLCSKTAMNGTDVVSIPNGIYLVW